jgi:hypothetical protein
MRHRLTIPIILAGALLVVGACGTDREPMAPQALPAPTFSRNQHQASPDDQIEALIRKLFPKPGLYVAASARFESIEVLVKKHKLGPAKKQALNLVAFTLEKYNANRLVGGQSSTTQTNLQAFIDQLFQFVGLGSAAIPSGALTEDGAVALVGPAGGEVVTGNKFAGVDFLPNTFTQTVLVTLNRNGNQLNPLPTPLPQFPLFYEFKTFPEVPTLGQPAVVGVCVLDGFVPVGHAGSLRLAHPLHSDPSTIEILPLEAAPFLDCSGAGLGGGFAARDRGDRSLASDLLWLLMGAPKDLHAESHNVMMPGGLGGRTKSFSTFGAVDFTGTLVPYQDTGYRYLQLGPGVDPPEDFAGLSFDDSEWSTGPAAFGTGSCPLSSTIHTPWPAASGSVVTDPGQFTSILLRKTFDLPAGVGDVTVGVAVDNDVQVFVNGVDVTASGGELDGTGFLRHENCPTSDSFILTVPDSVLHAGSNLIVIRARDRGVQSFVDIRVNGVLQED